MTAPPAHYPFVTRMAMKLHAASALPDVVSIEVEPDWGYATRIVYRCGATRMTFGSDIGLNSGAACEVVTDKAFTKHFLSLHGYATPKGATFLLPWWAERVTYRGSPPAMRTTGEAEAYARDELGLPVYVKPVSGSQGTGISRCDTVDDLGRAIAEVAHHRAKVIMVEEVVDMPDYRLVVLHDELISAYRRVPLTVVGDGAQTILSLLRELDLKFRVTGRDTRIKFDDPRIVRCLRRRRHSLDSVPGAGERVPLLDISNLSAGGVAEDVTAAIAPRWRDLARELTAAFGLQFCGVDIACADITDESADYSVLELNAAPGLDHYASVGAEQEAIVDALYARVLNAAPQPAPGATAPTTR